jgi:hypothetical protein
MPPVVPETRAAETIAPATLAPMDALPRLLVSAVVLVLLARAARVAWANRAVARAVWTRVRVRHVVGSLVLLAAVLALVVGLVTAVPVTGVGLGSLLGLTGNVVFAPVESIASAPAATASEEATLRWPALAAIGGFLALLVALFPWLAYVEERAFRAGLEHASLGRQIVVALRFGLLHLVMLIPLAAALAIGLAGFVYGRIYRAAYRRAAAFAPGSARAEAVLASTVWHATFNSLVVVLVAVSFVATSR